MHDPVLDEALKRLAAEASTRFTSLVATGDEIPFDVAENNGDSSHFYRYVPLTSRYISAHLDELRSLPSYGPARGAVASSNVAAPYLEARGITVPSEPTRRAEEMIAVFITGLWEGTTEFSLDISRVEAALASLEVESRDVHEADVLLAPLVGFEMTPSELELSNGLRIVRADSVDAPLEATTSEGTERSPWQQAFLAMAPLGDSSEGPKAAIEKLHSLVRALRLFKEGTVGLGPFAFAPIGDDAWRRVETGAAPPRPGSYFLIESESASLDQFMQKLAENSPRNEAIAFAEKRFQFGCERGRPVDALCDHLLAIRSALGGEGVIDAPLSARAAALITGEADDEQARRRIESALDLEQSLINNEETMMIGGESASYLAAWVEDSTRHILREAVLGTYDSNLNVVAEETLLTSGLAAGEGSASQMGSTSEWDVIPEPVAVEREEPAGAEIHVFKPRVVADNTVVGPTNVGPEVEAGVDPLFGSVPEFDPEPLPGSETRFESMPEIEAALGIDRNSDAYRDDVRDDSAPTRLFEPVPDPGELKVSATTEIGSTIREDWLSQTRPGQTMEWPAHAMDGLDSVRKQAHGEPDRKLFPAPETTEWSISEMKYRKK
ncbi:MAG TPA: hypothetical protein VMF31_09260 [Solirubrobacterales bacterium]|nr:hypothetical protein [Solirubrobacterales bacterium]